MKYFEFNGNRFITKRVDKIERDYIDVTATGRENIRLPFRLWRDGLVESKA